MEFNLLGQRQYPTEPSGEPPCPPRQTWFAPDTPDRAGVRDLPVLVLGYGLQGRPTAANLRDSGAQVTIGVRVGGASESRALVDGFPVHDLTQGVPPDIAAIFVLLPDDQQPSLLRQWIFPSCHAGQLVTFAHGLALLGPDLPMPAGVDVVVLAPHGPGQQLRERYLAGEGLPAQVALWRDPSGTAFQRALLWGAALGYDQGGIRPCRVQEEVHLDLFVEQTLLCGGLVELTLAVAQAAIAAGYDPEQVAKSTAYELGNTAALLAEHGPVGLYKRISQMALKGSLLNGPAMVPESVRAKLPELLQQIETGAFQEAIALESIREQLGRRMAAIKAHPVSQAYADWLSEGE